MAEPLAILDVDTQVDFMLPHGKLYVPGAEQIIPNLKKLFGWARERGIPIISSADAHPPDDPSFREWPPHCVVGTPGQQRIPETLSPNPIIVPNRARAFAAPPKWSGQWIVQKQEYDVSTNVNFDAMLAALGARRFVVFGVATEYCVLSSVLALRRHAISAKFITDAIMPITKEGGQNAIDQMLRAGALPVTTREVLLESDNVVSG